MNYKKIYILIGFILSMAMSGWAQSEKELPPIQPIQPAQSPDTTESDFDIPDVVIYGENQVRLRSQKESQYTGGSLEKKPTLIGQKDAAAMFRSNKGQQLLTRSDSERSRIIRAGVSYGNLNTINGNLFYGDRQKDLRFFGDFRHYSSDRIAENSEIRRENLETGVIYLFPQGSQIALQGTWDNSGYGLAGHRKRETEAAYNHLNGDFLLKVFPLATLHLTTGAQISSTLLEYDYADTTNTNEQTENMASVNLGLHKIWQGRLFTLGGEWRTIDFDDRQHTFLTLQGRTSFALGANDYIDQVGLEVGFDVNHTDIEDMDTESYFYPFARLTFKPYWIWGTGTISVAYDPKLSYQTLSQMATENPYLNPQTQIIPQDRKFSFTVSGNYEVSTIACHWGYHYAIIDDHLIWYEDDKSHTWLPAPADINQHRLYGNIEYTIGNRFLVGVGLEGIKIDFRDSDQWDGNVPYYPDFKGLSYLRWFLRNDLMIEINGQYMGERHHHLSDGMLSDYWWVGLFIQKQVIPNMEATINIQNLLDETYEQWAGYRESSAQVSAGLTFQW